MSVDIPIGQDLVDQVFLARAAVENWARFVDGPSDLIQARFALLDAIREDGQFAWGQPDWMTSAKPGVDAYIHFPDNMSLTLIKDPKGTDERPWLARNCIAPRRGSRRRETMPVALDRAEFTDQELRSLQALSGQELVERSKVSAHCLERWTERVGDYINSEQILQVVATGQVTDPPLWARMTGRSTPVCVVYLDDDELAFAITPNTSSQDLAYPFVIVTVLSRRWVEIDLLALTGQELADRVHLTSRALGGYTQLYPDQNAVESLQAMIRNDGRAVIGSDGPIIEIPVGSLLLRSGSTGRGAHDWLAQEFRPT